MEAHKNQVTIRYDFFKELHEESSKDEYLPTIPFAITDELFTHEKICYQQNQDHGW